MPYIYRVRAIQPGIEKDSQMNATISARILFHVANGMTLEAAINSVLGAAQYKTLVNEIYTALRSEG